MIRFTSENQDNNHHTSSTVRADELEMTLKDLDLRLEQLETENYRMKLRNEFLEENLRTSSPDDVQAALRENAELKSDKLLLERELQQYRKSLKIANSEIAAPTTQANEQNIELQHLATEDAITLTTDKAVEKTINEAVRKAIDDGIDKIFRDSIDKAIKNAIDEAIHGNTIKVIDSEILENIAKDFLKVEKPDEHAVAVEGSTHPWFKTSEDIMKGLQEQDHGVTASNQGLPSLETFGNLAKDFPQKGKPQDQAITGSRPSHPPHKTYESLVKDFLQKGKPKDEAVLDFKSMLSDTPGVSEVGRNSSNTNKSIKTKEAQGRANTTTPRVTSFKMFLQSATVALLSFACVCIGLSYTPVLFWLLMVLLSLPMAIIAVLAP